MDNLFYDNMDIDPEKDIRWDLLAKYMDVTTPSPAPAEDLTEQEWSVLQFMRQTRAQLKGKDAGKLFPADEGWRRFGSELKEEASMEQAGPIERTGPMERAGMMEQGSFAGDLEIRSGKLVWFRRYRYAAAIILALLLGAGGWWRYARRSQPIAVQTIASLPPTRGVRLILAGGQRVEVRPQGQPQVLQESGGVRINLAQGAIAYQPAESGRVDTERVNTLEVPRGNRSRLVLSDGTKVWVNAGSRITYPIAFSGSSREVDIEGEAYFEVSKDAVKPFIVHAKGLSVRVLGTAFAINTYEPVLRTTLEQGRVRVEGGGQEVELLPGEQAQYDPAGTALHKERVDTRLFTAWKDDNFYVVNAQFGEIAKILGRDFDYSLVFEDPAIAKLHFTLHKKKPASLQDLLDFISSTTDGIQFRVEGREVRISRKQ